MDLSRRYVCFFTFLGVFLLKKVLPCELPSGRRLECGTGSVSSSDQCPKTCCFNATTHPNCYFQENAYGPIQHSNGLCVNVQTDGSDTLIWSADCTSRNAFFLVSYDHPPYHIASGKCVLPSGANGDPRDSNLVLTSHSRDCNSNIVTYRPTENGNLEYYYLLGDYKICIGSRSGGGPIENEYVYIPNKACQGDNIKHALGYVYQRKFAHEKNYTIQCYLGRTIKIIWVNYDSTKTTCVSTKATQLMQGKCDGKTTCTFYIRKADFLGSSSFSGDSNTFLLRYTCKVDARPAAPKALHVSARGQTELFVIWSGIKNNIVTKFAICYWQSRGTRPGNCHNVNVSSLSSPTQKLSDLQPATKYNVTVARYSCDGRILGIERHKIAITRSAALKTTGEKYATSFQIQLGALQGDDKYVQIVVSKLRINAKPTDHPGNDRLPYDVKTVDNQPYIAAQLDGTNINQNNVFTVGDGKKYASSSTSKRRSTNYQNVQLEPETYYSVFQRTFKSADLYYDSDWMDVIKTDELLSTKTSPTEKLSPTKASSTPLTMVTLERVTTKQSGGGDASTGAEDGSEKYLAGIIVLIILVVILLVILAYFIYQNRRRKSLKANPENKSEDKNNSEEIDENPDNDDANYELVENEGSTYTALKRPGPGEEESDGHLYTHLIQVHTDYMIPKETGF